MAELAHITLETGDLSEFDSTVTGTGDLEATAAAAMVGSWGLSIHVDPLTNLRGEKDFVLATDNTGVRFYFNPNGVTMAGGNSVAIYWFDRGGTNNEERMLLKYNGANYEIQFIVKDDVGTLHFGSSFVITDDEHFIEVKSVRASSDVASDGTYELLIDGVSRETLTGKDNYDVFRLNSTLNFGGRNASSGMTGTYYIDDMILVDDGNTIGPASTVHESSASVTASSVTTSASPQVIHSSSASILVETSTTNATANLSLGASGSVILSSSVQDVPASMLLSRTASLDLVSDIPLAATEFVHSSSASIQAQSSIADSSSSVLIISSANILIESNIAATASIVTFNASGSVLIESTITDANSDMVKTSVANIDLVSSASNASPYVIHNLGSGIELQSSTQNISTEVSWGMSGAILFNSSTSDASVERAIQSSGSLLFSSLVTEANSTASHFPSASINAISAINTASAQVYLVRQTGLVLQSEIQDINPALVYVIVGGFVFGSSIPTAASINITSHGILTVFVQVKKPSVGVVAKKPSVTLTVK